MSDAQTSTTPESSTPDPVVVEQQVTPPAAETTATEVETQPQETQTEETQQTDRDEKGRFKGVQPRIDELTRARREAEREAAYWRQVAQAQNPASQAAQETEPTPDQFDDYSKYVKALTKWETKQAVAQTMQERAQQQQVQTRAQTFEQRMAEARKNIPDFQEVVGSADVPLADHIGEAMQESEHGPALAYHFAKNPDVLLRLNAMDEKAANREIGRLEASFAAKAAAAPAAPTKKVTQAPAPAGTLGTQGRATTPALANASMEEYMAQRKSQGARWAR